jgi:glycosyltransferase involved in cell wall biosynthesis
MLSILIPIYNFDVSILVGRLCEQGRQSGFDFEVVCMDDGSEEAFRMLNRVVRRHPEVNYQELPQNVGRSRIRNLLAAAARFEYLLIMDCDSEMPDSDYLRRYLEALQPGSLLYGGRSYKEKPPTDPALRLRWAYGLQREQQAATKRRQAPYHSFMTNNFLIPRAILLQIGFDESLKGYGHEDTLFGFELKKRNIPIIHLDNPLHHIGLEPAEVFLDKTREGIRNLYYLEQRKDIRIETRLLRLYRRLEKSFLPSLILPILALIEPLLIKNLKGRRPSMKLFDLLKLYWLLKESKIQ